MKHSPLDGWKRFVTDASWHSKAHRAWFTLCSACLALFVAYVTYLSKSPFLKSGPETAAALCWYLLYALALYAALWALAKRLGGVAPKAGKTLARPSLKALALFACLSLAVLGFALMKCYPGGVSYDAANQWRQAQSGEFNNWHPVFHTLLIWLTTRVCDSYPFAVAVQGLAFSLALAYLLAALHQNGVPKGLLILTEGVILLSPPVQNALMYLWKDNAMTVGCLVLCGQCAQTLFSRGKWLQRPRNALCFGLALAFTTLVRHNAILFTLPMLLCLLGCYGWKRKGGLLAAGTLLLCLLLVRGPLYGALDIVYPHNTTEEAVGLPMMILGNAKQAEPEALDGEANAFLLSLAPEESWQTVYRRSDYNAIKFTFPRELVATRSPRDILGMALRTSLRAPRLAFETFNEATDLVWDVSGQNEGYERVSNSGDLPEAPVQNGRINRLGSAVTTFLNAPMDWLPLRWLSCNVGAQLLLLLLTTLWALYRRGVEALLFALPPLVYDLATMLLLCGQDARFFQFTMAISLPSMLALLYASPGREN